jgi:epoxyqueuosine reductase
VKDEGFINPRIIANWRSPFLPDVIPKVPMHYQEASSSLLVTALPYGNDSEKVDDKENSADAAWIAPFARKNYYREAVKRLKRISLKLRQKHGGEKSSFRIFCNSPIPEKPLAEISGLGCIGRNSLIITKDAGSLVILAAMTLPFELESDKPELKRFDFCRACNEKNPPCKEACPTHAVNGDGTIKLEKCIQWYASGNGEEQIPEEVLAHWGNRLYGCSDCQDACPHNQREIAGTKTEEGLLPAYFDAQNILNMSDDEIKALFKNTAMGLSWLGPKTIRRNASIILC